MTSTTHRYHYHSKELAKRRRSMASCAVCKGQGFLPTGKLVAKDTFGYRNCKCRKKYFKAKKYILANIPKRRHNLLTMQRKKKWVTNCLTRERVSLFSIVARKYVVGFKRARKNGVGLMFFGNPGSGKTTCALYILMKLLEEEIDSYYIYFKDLISMLMEGYSDTDKSQLFKEITRVDFLVIDELSLIGRITPHMVTEFTSICKKRFESEQPTLLVSNYQTLDEVFHNFGAPMESLLNEAFIGFKFGGRDMRGDKYDYMKGFFE